MVDSIGAVGSTNTGAQTQSVNSYADLGSEDYFKLLVSQLSNQDPFEPTSSSELLQQISSIRDIEASTSLSSALEKLTSQQHYAAGSAMLGQYVSGPVGNDGTQISGVVVGVMFEPDGSAILLLDNGSELPLDSVSTVESAEQIGAALVGRMIRGTDTRVASNPTTVEGVVTGVRTGDSGEILLELDTGPGHSTQ